MSALLSILFPGLRDPEVIRNLHFFYIVLLFVPVGLTSLFENLDKLKKKNQFTVMKVKIYARMRKYMTGLVNQLIIFHLYTTGSNGVMKKIIIDYMFSHYDPMDCSRPVFPVLLFL